MFPIQVVGAKKQAKDDGKHGVGGREARHVNGIERPTQNKKFS